MRKRLISIILSATLVLGCAVAVSAATSATVTLTKSQYSASSAIVGDSASVSVYARNESSSAHNVKAVTYASSAGSTFYQADAVTMGPGTTMNIKTVNGPTSSTSYYLHLNPTAAFKNCEAYGSIRCR